MTTYTNHGDVRGSCGHRHRTLTGLAACWHADMSACTRQGGYSDRSPLALNGNERRRLTEAEQEEWEQLTGWRTAGRR